MASFTEVILGETNNDYEDPQARAQGLLDERYKSMPHVTSPYTLEYETISYQHGKQYTFESDLPKVGLVITSACNGFGCGTSNSYIVTKIYKNKKKEVVKADVSLIYTYKEGVSVNHSEQTRTIVQSRSKGGDWVWQGDKSDHMIYSIRFGELCPPQAIDLLK